MVEEMRVYRSFKVLEVWEIWEMSKFWQAFSAIGRTLIDIGKSDEGKNE
jgi:hypothetical protein